MKKIDSISGKNKAVIFNCKYPIKTMFHTNIIAYERIPGPIDLETIRSMGYKIYFDNHKEIKKELANIDFVNYIEITGGSKR